MLFNLITNIINFRLWKLI